jgi:hypothetical protein
MTVGEWLSSLCACVVWMDDGGVTATHAKED